MKAARFMKKGGDLEIVDMDKPTPKANEILIKVEACGVCHSDVFVQQGAMGNSFPRTPVEVIIYDVAGRELVQQSLDRNRFYIKKSGIYFVKIQAGSVGRVFKLIVE